MGDVLRGEWGFDGVVVSDWLAARDTAGALRGGLDIAMPGPVTVYGEALAAAVRSGEVEERLVDDAARRVLRLAARVGLLCGAPAAVAVADRPAGIDGYVLAREIAARACVLAPQRDPRRRPVLPLFGGGSDEDGARPAADGRAGGGIAVIGAAARDARILGGGSAQVFPDHVVSPLDGLRSALPAGVPVVYALGADPSEELAPAGPGFTLRAVARDAERRRTGRRTAARRPAPVARRPARRRRRTTRCTPWRSCGSFVPRDSGAHRFGTRGTGGFRLTVAGRVLFDGDAGGRARATRSRRSSAARPSAAPSNSPRANRSRSASSTPCPHGPRNCPSRRSGSACCTANPSATPRS